MVVGGASVTVDDAGNNASATGKDNVVAPTAYASGDIRTLSNEQTARVEKKMRAIVDAHLAKTGAAIEIGEGYPAMAPSERMADRAAHKANKTQQQHDETHNTFSNIGPH